MRGERFAGLLDAGQCWLVGDVKALGICPLWRKQIGGLSDVGLGVCKGVKRASGDLLGGHILVNDLVHKA